MSSQRMLRINELLKREIADLIERMDFNSGSSLVSVREVFTSPDLRSAKVHISILGGDERLHSSVFKCLHEHRHDLQSRIARDVILKYTPVLSFVSDSRLEEGDRVLAIIEELEKTSES